MENIENNLNIRIQLFREPNPFIYIQHDLGSKRYRVSTNYKYLNEEYKLKIQFIRNFSALDIKYKNSLIEILSHSGQNFSVFFKCTNFEEIEFKHDTETGSSSLKLFKFIDGNKSNDDRTSIIIFNKRFCSESSYSLFFASEKFNNLDEFLITWNGRRRNEVSS
jgi:hypothetical protein